MLLIGYDTPRKRIAPEAELNIALQFDLVTKASLYGIALLGRIPLRPHLDRHRANDDRLAQR